MNRERNAFKAGLFILFSIAAIVMIVISIKGASRAMVPMEDREVRFSLNDDLSGLRRGDDVRIGGFKVGIVKSIEIEDPKDAEPSLLVTFSLPQRYHLHDDSLVVVDGTLTGVTWLNVKRIGHGTEVAIADGKPGAMAALLNTLGEVAPEVKQVVGDVRTKTVPAVNTLIAHINTKVDPVADRTSQALGQVNDLLGDTKPDIRGTMKNLNLATATVRDKLPAIIEQLQTTLSSTNATLEDVKKIAAHGKDIGVAARSLLISNRGKIESIIAGLKTTSDNLKGASAEVRRSPWRLLYKPEPQEMANLNIYDSARQFAEGANELSDAATALRDSLNDPNVDKTQLQKLIQKLDDSFTGFTAVENKLWSTVK